MRNVKVIALQFEPDLTAASSIRTEEVRNLIAQMIELSHQRGRPKKETEEMSDAA